MIETIARPLIKAMDSTSSLPMDERIEIFWREFDRMLNVPAAKPKAKEGVR